MSRAGKAVKGTGNMLWRIFVGLLGLAVAIVVCQFLAHTFITGR